MINEKQKKTKQNVFNKSLSSDELNWITSKQFNSFCFESFMTSYIDWINIDCYLMVLFILSVC